MMIVNSKWFKSTSAVLMLTGKSRFDGDAEAMKREFLQRNRNPEKAIYTFVGDANDENLSKFVFNATVASILEANLKASGLDKPPDPFHQVEQAACVGGYCAWLVCGIVGIVTCSLYFAAAGERCSAW